ncbi:MAG: ScpA family protein, partial [Planctomycetota bacterium]
MNVFRVDLPAYRGPMDLLLYLVRRHELDLNRLPLARLIQQYNDYLEVLQQLDLAGVGDFIDFASSLIELKSQSVLPQIVDDEEEEIVEDSQDGLVMRLLEYKKVRDAAAVMEEMRSRWQHRYARVADDLPTRRIDPGSQPIAELQLWDLVSAFGRIMRESAGPPPTEVTYDETPIHIYMQQIHHQLVAHPSVPLMDFVTPGVHKS